MGIGMVLVAKPKHVDSIKTILKKFCPVYEIGLIVDGGNIEIL